MLRRTIAVAAAALVAATAVTATPGAAGAADPKPEVDRQVLAELAANGHAGFLVYLRDRADLSGTKKMRDADAKATQVYRTLTATADSSQRDLRADLDAKKASYRPFWISNAIWVDGDRSTLDLVTGHAEVEKVVPSRTVPRVQPVSTAPAAGKDAIEWGLTNVQAPKVWSDFGVRGEGIVVASIDGGVQYQHPALVGKYRGNLGDGSFDHNYNWFDPSHQCATAAPCDAPDGHGTHTMGTMIGDDGAGNQIGVAPGAKWITARGCETDTCSDAALLASGQWMVAPTDLNNLTPRPDLHPDVVNNSWGGPGGDRWYDDIVNAWLAAGIFPVFASGNSGPRCGSAESPGDFAGAYSVGAYDSTNRVASFSSRGSASASEIKPNISAPGVAVRSSVPDGYATFNGTSMAAPHVSGAVALMWSAAPSLKGDIAATRQLLDDTATDTEDLSCGGTTDDNQVYGEGRLNAFAAVEAAPRGPVGRITGAVTDSGGGNPIAGVTVAAGERSVTTGPDGRYTLVLPPGEHTVTATRYGYATLSATVTVTEGGAVTRDFALVAVPMVTVSGRVSDGSGHGWPLYAKLAVGDRPGGPVFTDPATGRYSFKVPGGAGYRVTVTAQYPGYQAVTVDVPVGTEDRTQDIAVPVLPECTAPGYGFGTLLSQPFDGTTTPSGWSVVNRSGTGGWQFTDDGNRGNLTGGSGGFAIVDSDRLGSSNALDTDLITPPMDLSGTTAPTLRFNSDYRAFSNGSADVDLTTDGGATWTTVWHYTTQSRRGPVVEEVPLAAAAGAPAARVRFRYQGNFAWWWQVDNVQVLEKVCTPRPGGLVVGLTTDKNTGAALNGVAVTSPDAPGEAAVSAGTPDDDALADGFYWLFSTLSGGHPFTATKAPYQATSKTVKVAANGATRADFTLGAGRIAVTATSVESHQPFGTTRNTTIKITNTGSAPAEVDLVGRAGTYELTRQPGAPLAEHKLPGGASKARGDGSGAAVTAAPSADSSWKPVREYPTASYDNQAATLNGKVYSLGGATSATSRKAYVYDPGTDTWSALPDMPNGRSQPSVAAVNGMIYAIGGWGDSTEPVASVDAFDPEQGAWHTVAGATNPAPRAAAGTAVADGQIYLVGGCVTGACPDSDDVVIFNPATGTFRAGAKYPHLGSYIGCGGIGGQVYCAGGSTTESFSDAYSYDPRGDAWTRLADMPLDLWASQYTAASGLLILAGGVTDGFATVTNRAVAYDPETDTWSDLPNAAAPAYRGAGACGAYKIGGRGAGNAAQATVERLGGLDLCGEGADADWLSSNPASFTLAAGASRSVKVTLTATPDAGIEQPGTYTASVAVRSDTPYRTPAIGVTMVVSPPPSWGKIQGTVTGVSCNGVIVPVPAAVRVNLASVPYGGYTLMADQNGRYAYWVPKGRYQVIVAKDGWIPEVQTLKIEAGITATLDFGLEPVRACAGRVGGI
ncbi:S8 family serine peptidase [Rhizomonospora bruguierae]|uniref:S8 family serine peptidase n=1 Tax=Rhizomonospora bruguierae TaxID=1581705 RepID=UPI001BCFCB95|nr:S8 family serine peptidase [Micromonospora sp. NBRC 107566]